MKEKEEWVKLRLKLIYLELVEPDRLSLLQGYFIDYIHLDRHASYTYLDLLIMFRSFLIQEFFCDTTQIGKKKCFPTEIF